MANKQQDSGITFSYIDSPLGKIYVGVLNDCICHLSFQEDEIIQIDAENDRQNSLKNQDTIIERLRKELEEYFEGIRKTFDIPLAPVGTPFQEKVWQSLLQIPYGATISYGQQSKQLGTPKAIRAIAHANGQNPISILIPCHRVVGSKGELTGYAGGLWRKQWLLELESPDQRLF